MLADIPDGYEFLYGMLPEFHDEIRAQYNTPGWPLPRRIDTGVYDDPVDMFGDLGRDLLEDPFNYYLLDGDVSARLQELGRRADAGLPLENFGTCDDYHQILTRWPFLITDSERYVIGLNRIERQPGQTGGWRWHKNGDYIGDLDPQCEYLDDEPEIDAVVQFLIYRFIDTDRVAS